MTARSTWRGHATEYRSGQWIFCDTQEPTFDSKRPCGHCGREPTPEGHDGCLGTLPGVANACCGHGVKEAYVQMVDGTVLSGAEAILFHGEIG